MNAAWFAFPLFSAFVALVWLFLVQSLSPGSLLLGLALGLFASFTLSRLQLPGLRPRSPLAALRLAAFVAVEIARSNIAVARITLRPAKERRSGFLSIPLETTHPEALALLSCILTATPGSLWVDYDPATGRLLLHVLDLIDEDAWLGIVRGYERRLKEIFR